MTIEAASTSRRDIPREQRIAEWKARKEARIERLKLRAEALRDEASARFNSPANRTLVSMGGEPIKVGHHSEGRHRRLFDRAHNDMRKGCEALAEAKRCEQAAEAAEGSYAVSSRDPEAIEQLRARLEDRERFQEFAKKVNAIIRKHKQSQDAATPDLLAAGVRPEKIPGLFKKDFAGRIGYADYVLKNNNAEIKRLKSRIAELERAATIEDETHEGNGCEVVITSEEGPVMIRVRHESKPPEDVRNKLKTHGFRWVPSRGFWHANANLWRRDFAIGLTR